MNKQKAQVSAKLVRCSKYATYGAFESDQIHKDRLIEIPIVPSLVFAY